MEVGNIIKCYFFGISYDGKRSENGLGISGFAIPDLGILYKNTCSGKLYECQYAGLLELLKFIDSNRKSFKGYEFEIYSDAAVVIYQMLHHKSISRELKAHYDAAQAFNRRIPFKVSWIPSEENPALMDLLEIPPLKSEIELRFEEKRGGGKDRIGKGYLHQ